MRLLYVTPYYKPAWFYGGPPKCIAEQAEYLVQKLGYEVDVVTLNQNGDQPLFADPGLVVQELAGVRVHYLPPAQNWSQRYFYSKMLKHYLSSFADVDGVHVHTLFNHFSRRGMQFARQHGLPFVVTPHGMLDGYSLTRSRWLKRVHRRLFDDHALAQAGAVQFTTPSERAAAVLSRPVRAAIVPIGFDFSGHVRNDHDTVHEPSSLRLIFLGRINRKKGLDRLAAGLAALGAKERSRICVDVFGEDDDQCLPALQAQLAELGLTTQFAFRGKLDPHQRDECLRTYDALVLTSHQENFGLVVVEALDQQLPVLISDKVNLSDFVAEHACGWVSSLDPADIARQLTVLYHTPPVERRARGARGQAAVRAAFNMEKVGGQLDALYRRLARA